MTTPDQASEATEARPGITRIIVEGYKSLRSRHDIAIRPLTVLAGVNSSGKSSAMQPLLLLKQTLEIPWTGAGSRVRVVLAAGAGSLLLVAAGLVVYRRRRS